MSPTSVNVIPTKTTVIDYGPDTSSHYPTLMKLKAVDKEIAMLTKSYETVNETSIMNIRQGHVLAAIENMEEISAELRPELCRYPKVALIKRLLLEKNQD